MVITAVRPALVLSETVTLTEPSPLPLVGVIDTQELFSDADQAQKPWLVVTATS
jgi:hypothetical protein